MKRIEVAVGIVYDDQGRVLIGQRVVKDLYFQKWEFPGGKLESGETSESALRREFKEEVGIDVEASTELMEHKHDYSDRHVTLYVRKVESYQGTIKAQEGQALRWVTLEELEGIDFLKGNQAIIEKLKE